MKITIKKINLSLLFFLFLNLSFAKEQNQQNQNSEKVIQTFFNNSETKSYTDPYRNIAKHGDNFEEIIINQIKKAEQSILIAVQEFRLPNVALALLEQKRRVKGLDIRIVIDNKYNDIPSNYTMEEINSLPEYEKKRMLEYAALIDMNKNGKFELEEKSVRDAMWILKTNNIPLIDDTFGSQQDPIAGKGSLMHHKFVVIDSKTLIVTTANFTLSDIHGDILAPQTKGNQNSLLLINNEKAAQIYKEEFEYMWSGKFGLKKPYRGTQIINISKDLKIKVHFSPTKNSRGQNEDSTTNGLIIKELTSAKESVYLALFVFSEQNISDQLESLYDQNIDVRVLIEPLFAYREYSNLLDMWGLELLNTNCKLPPNNRPWKQAVTNGGVVNLPEGDMLHHKFAVIDNNRVIVGSQNWSNAANVKNDESLLVIENSDVNRLYSEEYFRLAKNSRLGPPKKLLNLIEERKKRCTSQSGQEQSIFH